MFRVRVGVKFRVRVGVKFRIGTSQGFQISLTEEEGAIEMCSYLGLVKLLSSE